MISICIPAYKRVEPLKKLLDSIALQSFRDFEVIVTDDSPDGSVEEVCRGYQDKLPLKYFRNITPLGTPENWNEGIRRAGGEWIKPMHDDDWFFDQDSLALFAGAIKAGPDTSFIFSAYRNVYPSGLVRDIFPEPWRLRNLLKEPATLFAGNCIGPPSCILYKRKTAFEFDDRFKWLVDIEFYIRYLTLTQDRRPVCLSQGLINVGISDTQVTRETFGNRQVEIPEYFRLLEKTGVEKLKNIWIYDAWWRLMRNLAIKNVREIRDAGFSGPIPAKLSFIIAFQRLIPGRLLKIGLVSKIYMTVCYVLTYFSRNEIQF